MGTGQTLLTIAAMMMLSRMMLSVNNSNAQSGGSVEMAAYRITGTSLGKSIIEEATGCAYDQNSDTVVFQMCRVSPRLRRWDLRQVKCTPTITTLMTSMV